MATRLSDETVQTVWDCMKHLLKKQGELVTSKRVISLCSQTGLADSTIANAAKVIMDKLIEENKVTQLKMGKWKININ